MWAANHRRTVALVLVAQIPLSMAGGAGPPALEEGPESDPPPSKYEMESESGSGHNSNDLDQAIYFFIVLVATFLVAYLVKYALDRRKKAKMEEAKRLADLDDLSSQSNSDSDSYDVFDQALQPIELESFNGIPQSEIDQFARLQKEGAGGLGGSTGSCNPITNLSDSLKKQHGGSGRPPAPAKTPFHPPLNTQEEPKSEQPPAIPAPAATINLPPPPHALPREKPQGKSD